MLSLFDTQTGCRDPIIRPSDTCVTQGHTFTCTETSGHPAPPNYSVRYWAQNGTHQLTAGQSSYVVHRVGLYSLSCAVRYFHPRCPQYSTVCHRNVSGRVIGQYRTSFGYVFEFRFIYLLRNVNHNSNGVAVTRWSRSTQLLYIEPG